MAQAILEAIRGPDELLAGIGAEKAAQVYGDQQQDAEFLARRNRESVPPLYGMRDATNAVDRMVGLPYDTWFDVVPGMRATFTDAGHILGSASVTLECVEGGTRKRIIF